MHILEGVRTDDFQSIFKKIGHEHISDIHCQYTNPNLWIIISNLILFVCMVMEDSTGSFYRT